MQRLGDVLGEIEDVVQPVDQRVDARARKRQQPAAAQQRQRLGDDHVRALFDRFDVAHASVRITHVGQQFGKRVSDPRG